MTTANFAPNQRRRLSLAACKNPAGVATLSASTRIRKPLAISMTIGLLLGSIGTASAALSAVTAKTIQGTAPYIQLNGVPLTSTAELISIQIGTDTYTSDALGNMQKVGTTGTFTTPIELPVGSTFNSVSTIVPANNTMYSLNNTAIISTSDYGDDDGDGNFTLNGNIRATWLDKFGNVITSLNDPLKLCHADYTLRLTAMNSPSIATQYGDPRLTTYGNATALFKFSVPITRLEPCWAKPDMKYATGQNRGPATMWDTSRGFIPQSYAASNSVNFPTTGADGLYFDLTYAGANSPLSWATINPGNGISYTLTDLSNDTVRVTLKGPTATSAQKIPASSSTPVLVRGQDTAGNILEYGFTLSHWYINNGSNYETPPIQQTFCTTTHPNYRLPSVKELTNASGTAYGIGGMIPPFGSDASSGNWSQRRIGGGIVSEWGDLGKYTGTGFIDYYYWASHFANGAQFLVYAGNGHVNSLVPTYQGYGMCVYP